MVGKKQILSVLSQVIDPELGMNLVDLGLVYGVDVKPKKKGKQQAFIKMTFTTPACPMINEILNDVKARLDSAFKDMDIEIIVVFDPPWTTECMSEKAKIKLGLM